MKSLLAKLNRKVYKRVDLSVGHVRILFHILCNLIPSRPPTILIANISTLLYDYIVAIIFGIRYVLSNNCNEFGICGRRRCRALLSR